jgi:hypothetical protein
MNLDEMLKAKPRRSNSCKWSVWYNSISEGDRMSIMIAFADEHTATSHIVRVLTEYGCPMSESTIRTHRLNECKTCQGN